MKRKPLLSVIVPVYNEEKRINSIPKIANYLKTLSILSELVIVDDGSTDKTSEVLEKYQRQYGCRVLSYKQNRGKGYAIRHGMQQSVGEWRLFMDVDLSVPLSTISRLVPMLESRNQTDIIIGTRRAHSASVLVHQAKAREFLGAIFTNVSRVWLNVWVTDFTCGFKCFSERAAKKIFVMQRLDGWGFDAEILFIARCLYLPYKELPVSWRNDSRTKVRFPRDLFRSIWELWLIRYLFWRGNYR